MNKFCLKLVSSAVALSTVFNSSIISSNAFSLKEVVNSKVFRIGLVSVISGITIYKIKEEVNKYKVKVIKPELHSSFTEDIEELNDKESINPHTSQNNVNLVDNSKYDQNSSKKSDYTKSMSFGIKDRIKHDISKRKGISILRKFFNLSRTNYIWRSEKIEMSREELIQLARELWPKNDQIDDRNRSSCSFADYLDGQYGSYFVGEEERELLKKELRYIQNISEDHNYLRYKQYKNKEERKESLSEEEKSEYEQMKKDKYIDELNTIENIVNSHENHCGMRLASIIKNISNELDLLEAENGPGEIMDANDSPDSIKDKIEDYAITLFKKELYNKALGKSAFMKDSESVMSLRRVERDISLLFSHFDCDYSRASAETNEVLCNMVNDFDLTILKESAKNEANGIFRRFPQEIIDVYRTKCMENEVSLKEYCFFTNKKEREIKNYLQRFIDSNEEEDQNSIKAREALSNWINEDGNKMSFKSIKEKIYELDLFFDFSSKLKESDKTPTTIGNVFPELFGEEKNEDVANIFMIQDMSQNGYFSIDNRKIEREIN